MAGTIASSELHPILNIPQDKLPKHIAIIMDGNGRWAQGRGLTRADGHRQGCHAVRKAVTEAAKLDIKCITLYSFSTENWNRPQAEIDILMKLYQQYLIAERPTIVDNNIRLRHIGMADRLPQFVIDELKLTEEMSANNTGMHLCLALNYSGRSELTCAMQAIAKKVKAGEISPEDITEEMISDHNFTVGLPDPDLIVRTSGEFRISNFLIWQGAYAEIVVTDTHWPDYDQASLRENILEYAKRKRRFGGLDSD